MSSLEIIPRTTYVVSLLLFATAIGQLLVSGETMSQVKDAVQSAVTVETTKGN